MATDLDAQYAALDRQVAAARDDVRIEYQAGLDIAKQSGLTGSAARTFARQRPEYTQAKADQQSLTEQRNAVDAQRRAATQVRTPYGTTQTEYYDPNTGESGTYISRPTPTGDKPVSQTAADVTPSQDPVPQEWSYGPSVTQSNPTQLPDIQLQEPTPTTATPQPSTADQPIPFISDETYLDPLYEPAPTSGEASPIPYISDENYLLYGDFTSDPDYEAPPPNDLEPIPYVSDSENLGYRDTLVPFDDADMENAYEDELYEPVPTDAELASLQEQMDEDAEFAAIDEEFQRIDAINDPAIYTTDEASYVLSGTEFEEFESDPPYSPPPFSMKDTRSQGPYAANANDWRFRVQLSSHPDVNYLYRAPDAAYGILRPLIKTDGVIFPYTPSITMTQTATYNSYNPTHSNFRGHWYQGSQQGDIIVNATFTAQDTSEAEYMLAVMHFFRAASKMFYGQNDNRRGTPPPLLYLNGLGEYQFNEHPCLLSMVTYTLPDNVDYIKTSNTASATYQPQGRTSAGSGYESWGSKITRLITGGLEDFLSGGAPTISNFTGINGVTKITDGATYVPTQLQIQLNFLPVNTRQQVSQEYSSADFASGKLLKKGYW
jgi:hypothetical protein